MADMRNPYGVLGLSFGASSDQAQKAFARKARGLRRAPGGADKLTELTWALNQIQDAIKDPRIALDLYRIPADSGSLDPTQPGLLRPPPQTLERKTGSSEEDWARLIDAAGKDAVRGLVAEIAATSQIPAR